MRYITAIIGAIFIFVSVLVVCFVACAFLPGDIHQRMVTINLGWFSVWASPSVLIGVPLAIAAAIHTFRSTLRRCAIKDGLKAPANQPQPTESN